MAHFAGRREIGVKFPMRAISVDPFSFIRPQGNLVAVRHTEEVREGLTSVELCPKQNVRGATDNNLQLAHPRLLNTTRDITLAWLSRAAQNFAQRPGTPI